MKETRKGETQPDGRPVGGGSMIDLPLHGSDIPIRRKGANMVEAYVLVHFRLRRLGDGTGTATPAQEIILRVQAHLWEAMNDQERARTTRLLWA